MTGSRYPVVRVEGLRTLQKTLKAAGRDMADLKAVNTEVAQIVVAAAIPRTPVGPPAGGHIRDDVRGAGQATSAVIKAGRASRPYGAILHARKPWLRETIIDTQHQWIGVYERGIQAILDTVEGAPRA